MTADGVHHLVIAAARGTFAGQPAARSYEVRVHGAGTPAALTVNGRNTGSWSFDARDGSAVARVPARPVGEETRIEWR